MSTYSDLIKQIEKLTFQAEELRQKEIEAAVADIKEKMATFGITLADLGGASRKSKTKAVVKAVPVKFRGPKGEEWSGRGRTPKWLADAEANGRKRESFSV